MHAYKNSAENKTFALFEMSIHIKYGTNGFSVSAPKASGDRAVIWDQPWGPYEHHVAGDNANVSSHQALYDRLKTGRQ